MKIQVSLFSVGALLLFTSYVLSNDSSLEANKELVQQYIESYNNEDFDRFDDLFMTDMVRHTQSAVEVHSLDEFKENLRQSTTAFPDHQVEIKMIVAEKDKVVTYGIWSGTQKGSFGTLPATGKKATVQFFYLFRIEGGKIAEFWTE